MKKLKIKNLAKGFTLIELMVSMSIFILVMTISMGAILTTLDANRKSASLRSVMDNLNFTLEGMTRTIRFGSAYHCGATVPLTTPLDCSSGSNTLALNDSNGIQVVYSLVSGQIMRTMNGSSSAITSPDVVIQNMSFRVFGSALYPNTSQPQTIMIIKGYVTGKNGTDSSFTLETMVSQRKLDIQ